jgi:hypothetical protein
MKLIDPEQTIVVVTGSTASARAKDLPLALELKAEIDRRGSGVGYRRAVVVRDARYVATPSFHRYPTITIGGPGSNEVSGHLSQVLPTLVDQDRRYFVQMTGTGPIRQAALWGMDAGATKAAVELFVAEGYLDSLLESVWSEEPPLVC